MRQLTSGFVYVVQIMRDLEGKSVTTNTRICVYVVQIMRDPDTGNSKGYAFINFASFEASDAAIEAMNGQYLCNRPITISYAFKKDSKGERHGSAAGGKSFLFLRLSPGFFLHCIAQLQYLCCSERKKYSIQQYSILAPKF